MKWREQKEWLDTHPAGGICEECGDRISICCTLGEPVVEDSPYFVLCSKCRNTEEPNSWRGNEQSECFGHDNPNFWMSNQNDGCVKIYEEK